MISPKFPLTTVKVEIEGREWKIRCVQDQDALLDAAETVEHFPFGYLLWEAAVGLSRCLAVQPSQVADLSVLELGAGVGLPGLVACSLGSQVTQTDHQTGALALARENALTNEVRGIEQFVADWRDWRHGDRYDVLLGSDIFYDRESHYHLEKIFCRCLKPDGYGLFADPGRPQALEFIVHLEKSGWSIDMETLDVLLENHSERKAVEVVLWKLKRKQGR